MYFWYLVKSVLSSERYFTFLQSTHVHWKSHLLQGTKKTRPCLTGQWSPVVRTIPGILCRYRQIQTSYNPARDTPKSAALLKKNNIFLELKCICILWYLRYSGGCGGRREMFREYISVHVLLLRPGGRHREP